MAKKPIAFRLSDMTLSILDEIVNAEGADSRTEMLERIIYSWRDVKLLRDEVDKLKREVSKMNADSSN